MRGFVLDLLDIVCGDGVMSDETRVYNCGGLPVELALPEGEHTEDFRLSLKITDKYGLSIWECV